MNDKITGLIANSFKFIIIALGVLFALLIFFKEDNAGAISGSLHFTKWVLIILTLIAVGFGVFYFATNIRQSIPFVIGIGVFILLIAIGYFMASDVVLQDWIDRLGDAAPSTSSSKWSGAGMIVFYCMFSIAILSIVVLEVMNIIKNRN